MALIAKGQKPAAAQLFAKIAADKGVPDSLRARAVQVAGTLGVDASASLPTGADRGRMKDTIRMTRTTTSLALFAAAALLSGCGIINKKPKSTPTIGDRVSVLVSELDIAVDPETAAAPMALPAATANADWAQSGGNAAKLVEHVALGASVGPAWSASIGEGSTRSRRLGGGPVVAGGKVFTIDTIGSVRAFDATHRRGPVGGALRRRQGQ